MIRTFIALVLTVSSAAACPTADDLETGIVIDREHYLGVNSTVIRHLGGGLYWQGVFNDPTVGTVHTFSHLGLFRRYSVLRSGAAPLHRKYSSPLVGSADIRVGNIIHSVSSIGLSGGIP